MKLEKWALVAEIISGVAVVVTLLFLFAGIRENTSTTRAVAYANLIDSVNELESKRLGNTELTAHWRLFREGRASDLSEDQYTQLALYTQMMVRNYEKAYYDNEYGIIGPNEWERFYVSICRTYRDAQRAGFRLFNPDSDFTAISVAFRDFVIEACDD